MSLRSCGPQRKLLITSDCERFELHSRALAEKRPLVARIETRDARPIRGPLAIIAEVAIQGEQATADFHAVDLHDRPALAGWRADRFAHGHGSSIHDPFDAILGAVIADRI